MSGLLRLVFAALAAAMTGAPSASQPGPLGAECRSGVMSSCSTLCNRGHEAACAKASGQGPGADGSLMVEFGERSLAEIHARGLMQTGLTPVFSKDARCPPIASAFGDRTRYDGSMRASRANFGLHGGIDLSLPAGTPVLAIAPGTIINKRRGGLLVGIEVIVRHAPEDTGLKAWTFSKYKHFSKMTALKVGQRVELGEVIGPSGDTGTVGGHYGKRGYPHLHLSTYTNDDGAYSVHGGRVDIKDGRHVDPVAFFFRRELDSGLIRKLPAEERKVAIPYKTNEGMIVPPDAKAIWPVACKAR
jgi:murein DD-endopeptidase MepM/ murein hydrolase activator NlpD